MELSRLISKATWCITALAAIHMGLAYFKPEYNIVSNVMSYIPADVVFGLYLASGLYSLVMLFMHCGSCCE